MGEVERDLSLSRRYNAEIRDRDGSLLSEMSEKKGHGVIELFITAYKFDLC